MSEPEKKGSPWPWILVPLAAVGLFFVLRQCRQNLPPSAIHPAAPAVATPAAADSGTPVEPRPGAATTPAPGPAPQ
jgi:hypothetical protein